MSDKDPFAEPHDTEKTVIRPNPAGRRGGFAAPPPSQPAPPPPSQGYSTPSYGTAPAEPAPADPLGYGVPQRGVPQRGPAQGGGGGAGNEASLNLQQAITGMNVMNACASTLFSLVSRIRNRAQHMDPEALRRNVMAEIRAFENAALQAGIEAGTVKIARYAICATIDDVVLNTPWGGQSIWAQQSMVGTFHRETVGGDRFYDLLARLEQEPGKNIDLLEFLYMCLSLGFEGRLRVEAGGSDKHLQIRNGLARIIRGQRGAVEHDLSPHWKGVDRPHRALSAWKPVWIALAASAALLASGFIGLTWALNAQTARVSGEISALDNGAVPELLRRAPPPPPPPPPPEQKKQIEKVQEFLKPEIDEGLVEVFQDANTLTIRIAGSGMFGSGSDKLVADFEPKIDRVAEALNDEPGPIIVVGHSDNVPIRSAKFPSNMALSLARAESVKDRIAGKLDDASRLKAEGRADKEPIAPNNTAEGRAKNRRIEIVLVRNQDQ